jgi:hypothetical protein
MQIIKKKDLKKMDALQDSSSDDKETEKKSTESKNYKNEKKITDIEKQLPQEHRLTNDALNASPQNDIELGPSNITGLTHDKNKTFQMFFDKYPSINKEIIEFQRKRFEEN